MKNMRTKVVTIMMIIGLSFLSFINGTPDPQSGLQIGNKAPRICAYLIDGTPIDLDSLKGKMILIDFWASYDANSRIENIQKKNIFNKYEESCFINADGLIVVSISLDRFKTPLKMTIESDELYSFKHLCDYYGQESDLAMTYKVENNNFPNFLIDGEGRIVASDVSLDEIDSTLHRLEEKNMSNLALNLSGSFY